MAASGDERMSAITLVDVRDRDGKTDEDVCAIAGPVEKVLGAPRDDGAAEADERLQDVLERHQLRSAAVERATMLQPKLVCSVVKR